MTITQAVVLGVVQGLTEFLPVSSTAHLRITPPLCGWESAGGPAFDTVIQLGTLLAVLFYFRKDLALILHGLLQDLKTRRLASNPESRLAWQIAIATVPVVVCGLLFKKKIEGEFRHLYVVAGSLAVFALVLYAAEMVSRRRQAYGQTGRTQDQLTLRDMLLIGLFQCVALIPGASRSGMTISGALFAGLERGTAARVSFLMSLPALFGAGMYQLYKERKTLLASSDDIANLLVGTVVSAIVGYLVVAWLIGFLKRRSMLVFIVYRLLLAGVLVYLVKQGIVPAEEGLKP